MFLPLYHANALTFIAQRALGSSGFNFCGYSKRNGFELKLAAMKAKDTVMITQYAGHKLHDWKAI